MNTIKRSKWALVTWLSLSTSLVCYAEGGSESHGGSGIACFRTEEMAAQVRATIDHNRQNEIQGKPDATVDPLSPGALSQLPVGSVELLDLYLARHSKDGQLIDDPLISLSLPFQDIISDREDQIRRTNILLFTEILSENTFILPFDNEHWRASTFGLNSIDDAKIPLHLPKNCVHIQIAYQQVENKKQATVFYDSRLFERMPPVDQAALFFHERIYNHLVNLIGANDSVGAQRIVAKIFQKNFGPTIAGDCDKLLLELKAAYDLAKFYEDWTTQDLLNSQIEVFKEGSLLKLHVNWTKGWIHRFR